jgi:hypothetical protein
MQKSMRVGLCYDEKTCCCWYMLVWFACMCMSYSCMCVKLGIQSQAYTRRHIKQKDACTHKHMRTHTYIHTHTQIHTYTHIRELERENRKKERSRVFVRVLSEEHLAAQDSEETDVVCWEDAWDTEADANEHVSEFLKRLLEHEDELFMDGEFCGAGGGNGSGCVDGSKRDRGVSVGLGACMDTNVKSTGTSSSNACENTQDRHGVMGTAHAAGDMDVWIAPQNGASWRRLARSDTRLVSHVAERDGADGDGLSLRLFVRRGQESEGGVDSVLVLRRVLRENLQVCVCVCVNASAWLNLFTWKFSKTKVSRIHDSLRVRQA